MPWAPPGDAADPGGAPVVVEDAAPGVADEALFHLFNAVAGAGGHWLVTCPDAPARWARGLPALLSRLRGGHTVPVAPPAVARVEPAACEGIARGLRILQIAFHRDVAAEHDFADRLAVARHFVHRKRIDDRHAFLRVIPDALPAVQLDALCER